MALTQIKKVSFTKRKWPSLIACSIGISMCLLGYTWHQSVKRERSNSIERKVEIVSWIPQNHRKNSNSHPNWYDVSYTDKYGVKQSAPAYAPSKKYFEIGDSAVAQFFPGRKGAKIENWSDWIGSIVCFVIGLASFFIGKVIWTLLDTSNSQDDDEEMDNQDQN